MDYACRRADAICALSAVLSEKISRDGFADLYSQVEMPLVSVLAAMEKKGVLLNTKLLKEMSAEMEQLMSLSEEKIYGLAGEKFNVNSPKQLQVILFEKLGLPKGKKTKEGYSTDVDVLTNLARSHELPAEILSYRSFAKLKSTYIDALPAARQSGYRTHPYLIQPDRDRHGQAFQQQPEFAEHPHQNTGGKTDQTGIYRPGRLGDHLRRLFPDRTPHPRPSLRRQGAHRRVHAR